MCHEMGNQTIGDLVVTGGENTLKFQNVVIAGLEIATDTI